MRLAESEVPESRGLGLLAGIVDLVRDEEDGLAALAEQLHDVLVGRRGADHRVDDEQHDVGEIDRDLGLSGDGAVDTASVGLPAAGVDEREATVGPLGLVRHAVAGHTGGVLDDCLATAEDAVDESRLADVRSTDDRDDRQGREELDPVLTHRDAGEKGGIFIVQVVVGEAGAQGLGARLRELLVERLHLLGELVGAAFVFVVSHGVLLGFVRSPRGRRRWSV